METEKKTRKEVIDYVADSLRRLVMYNGISPSSELNQVVETVVDSAINIAGCELELLTIEDCVKRAREIAKSKMNCDVKITITYGD